MRSVSFFPIAATVLGVMLIAGCDPRKPQAPPPPPVQVTVSQPARQQFSGFLEFSGNTVAFASVDICARVKGYLKKVAFVEGATVEEGQPLFEIEPELYEAELERARAALQAAQARRDKARADLAIKEEMAAGNAASKLEVIQAQASLSVANAEIASATAQVVQAKTNAGYTKISAPVAGRIDRARVDVGNLVGAGGDTLLANIVQADPIYVYFDVDEPTVQRFQARLRQKGIDLAGTREQEKGPFTLALGNTGDFSHAGVIDFVDNKVDTGTGTIKVRGRLRNADRAIAPGYFARVRIPDGDPYDALLVPDRAIGVEQGQKFVLVVDESNTVRFRAVETGPQQGRLRVIRSGLSPTDWVITEGILRTRPGAVVVPQRKPLSPAETRPAETRPTASTGPATQPAR